MPPSGDAPAAEQKTSGAPLPGMAVSSAMMAKVGAAASDSQRSALASSHRRRGLTSTEFCSRLMAAPHLLAGAFPERGFAGIGDLDPPLVGRGAGDVAVVPVPPLVGRGLRVTRGRVLPHFL